MLYSRLYLLNLVEHGETTRERSTLSSALRWPKLTARDLKLGKFDVVFLDMTMAKLNGHDTLMRLQQVDPKVRVVLTTGFTHNQQVQSALGNGAYALLPKPFKIAELSRVIDDAIRR